MSEVKRYNTELEKDGGHGLPSLAMRSSSIGSWVEYKDYAALEAKCAALAADNSALNKFIKDDCWIWDDKSEEYFDAADCMPETPATDAYLAEVRAQGADAVADQHRRKYEELKPINVFFANEHMGAQEVAEFVAVQLRQDANTAELVAAGIITKVGE